MLAQLLLLRLQRFVQLLETTLAKGVVGRPIGLVEAAAGRVNGTSHVLGRGVGHFAQHLFGGGIDVVEPLARRSLDELAVDEHAHFADAGWVGHGCAPSSGIPRRDYEAVPRMAK